MIVTKPYSEDKTIEGIFRGHWFSAEVEDSPSLFGIEGSRVTHLMISKDVRRPEILNGKSLGYCYTENMCVISDHNFIGIMAALMSKLINLPPLKRVPPTPNISQMVKSYINHSAFGGLYKDGCCCWGDGIMECQKVINVDVSMCRAGYKHKSRLDGVTIKPYPPEKK